MTCECIMINRLATVSAKCSDLCSVELSDGRESEGYVPHYIGIGGADYIDFTYCLECGRIQEGDRMWPIAEESLEADFGSKTEFGAYDNLVDYVDSLTIDEIEELSKEIWRKYKNMKRELE